ncbi:MAG: IS66 family transposase, partial [Sedimentisphaerales bacterium]|nr:IS66 family transposase [Sedimentisphaerales bacterium]
MIHTLFETIEKYESKIDRLEHGIKSLLRQRFGRKSERLEDIDPRQLLPFMREYLNELKAQEKAEAESVKKEKISNIGNKPKRRNSFPADMERQQIIHDLDDSEKTCSCCGIQMERIGEDKSEQLEYIPARLFIKEHIRYKYACKNKQCEGSIETAPKANQPLEKSLAASGLLTHVAVSKYLDHLPLYRIEGIFKRYDIDISRSTMCGWMMNTAELLVPLYELLKAEVLKSRVIKTDDTPVSKQDKNHPNGISTSRLWIYAGDGSYPYYVYDFTPDRSRNGPAEFLKEFTSGYIQADAYAGYDFIFNDKQRSVEELLCWAHARRKFHEARKTAPQLSLTAMVFIQQLYKIEKDIVKLPRQKRFAIRQEKSVKILADFKQWLDGVSFEQALPESPFRKAMNYAANGWDALCRYASDGDFDIDNNEAERQMKPVAIGRKNWLFMGSDRGGRAAAILMSVLQSAARNGNNPQVYLKDIINRISDIPHNR